VSNQPISQQMPLTYPRLNGQTLIFARLLWFFVSASAAFMFIAALPFRWAMLMNPSPTNLTNLLELGLTPTFFAAYSIFWELFIALPNIIVGIIIFKRCGDQRIALLTSTMLIVFGVANGTITPTIRSILGIHPGLDFLQHSLEFIAWFSFALFFYLFPNGRFVPSWTRWLALLLLPIFLLWNFVERSPLSPPNWLKEIFMIFFLIQFGSWVLSQTYRYRRVSNRIERQQTKWVVFAIVTTLLVFMIIGAISNLIPGYNFLVEEQPTSQSFAFMLGTWLISPVMLLIPIGILFSIIRYRLWDIDLVINRTLVYGLLTIITMGLYIFIVVYFGNLLQEQTRPVVAFLATGLIAVVFQPFRLFLQTLVNRLMYGDRDDPYNVLSNLRQRLDLAISPGDILPTILETVSQALKLPYAAIKLLDESKITHGSLPVNSVPEEFPLINHGEIIGNMVVATRSPGERFTSNERRLLQDIAHQASVVVQNLNLNYELQNARTRLVTAREEERRRLRRDLHDGLGPKLAGQALILEAIRDTLQKDSQNRFLVEHLISDSQSIVQEVRQLVHGLRPPALDDHGLIGALRLLVEKFESSKLKVSITVPETIPVLPAAIEVAVYRIIQEAMTNVVKHAKANNCQIILNINNSFEITMVDDGQGFKPTRQSGVGLISMRERTEEIGGNFKIQAGKKGGTLITARFPLGVDQVVGR
jgi:signal transduction histidine kinase